LPSLIVAIAEFQMKRYVRRGELCLHLHAVFVARHPNKTWAMTPAELQKCWNDCLVTVLGDSLVDANMSATCNVQRVKKSAGGYLGKYMSKSGKEVRQLADSGHEEQLPHSWVCITAPMRKWVARSVRYVTGAAAQMVYDLLFHAGSEYVQWRQSIKITFADGSVVPMGEHGTLTQLGMTAVLGVL